MTEELRALAADLRSVKVQAVVSPILSKAGAVMRDNARAAAPTGPHLPRYARTIQFKKDGPLAVEVFARSEGQGNLGAILEFGQGPNGPHPHIIPQLEPEAQVAADWIGRAIPEALA